MATTAEQFSRISLDKGPDNSYSGDLINTIELALSENINEQIEYSYINWFVYKGQQIIYEKLGQGLNFSVNIADVLGNKPENAGRYVVQAVLVSANQEGEIDEGSFEIQFTLVSKEETLPQAIYVPFVAQIAAVENDEITINTSWEEFTNKVRPEQEFKSPLEKFTTYEISSKINDYSDLNTYMHLGDDNLSLITNVKKDNETIKNYPNSGIYKLYEPLPDDIEVKDNVFIVKEILPQLEQTIELFPYEQEDEDVLVLRNPESSQVNSPITNRSTELKNYTDLVTGDVRLKKEIEDKFISGSRKPVTLNIDYSNYKNFVNFSSAQKRLENFKYKIELIEDYTSKSASYASIPSPSDAANFDKKIRQIKTNFDGYENYLYNVSSSYESSSLGEFPDASWPKTGSGTYDDPFVPVSSSHADFTNWYGSIYGEYGQIYSASLYDNENKNRLKNLLPTFVKEDENNSDFFSFMDMVGQHFDELWVYTNGISELTDRQNDLSKGFSNDLVFNLAKSLGWSVDDGKDLLDLSRVGFGQKLSGDSYSLYTSGSSGFSKITDGTATSVPEGEITKEITKRLIASMPYILKTKGTINSLKAILNCYGIPSSILRVREYGGLQKIGQRQQFEIARRFTKALGFRGDQFIRTPWDDDSVTSRKPDTVEFRFRVLSGSAEQILVQKDSDWAIKVKDNGQDDNYGTVAFQLSGSPGYQEISSSLLPVYDGEFYSVMLRKNKVNTNLFTNQGFETSSLFNPPFITGGTDTTSVEFGNLKIVSSSNVSRTGTNALRHEHTGDSTNISYTNLYRNDNVNYPSLNASVASVSEGQTYEFSVYAKASGSSVDSVGSLALFELDSDGEVVNWNVDSNLQKGGISESEVVGLNETDWKQIKVQKTIHFSNTSGLGVRFENRKAKSTILWDDVSVRRAVTNTDDISDAFIYDLFVKKYDAGVDRITQSSKTSLYITGSNTTTSSYNAAWTGSGDLFIGGNTTTSFGTNNIKLSGSIMEFRLWTEKLEEDKFDTHVSNPQSYIGNSPSSSYFNLVRRFPMDDNTEFTGSNEDGVRDTRPNQDATQTGSAHGFDGLNFFESVNDKTKTIVPNFGPQRRTATKIRIENNYLSGSGAMLSRFSRYDQSSNDFAPLDSNKLGVYFSPVDAVNDDIVNSFANLDFNQLLGDPRDNYESEYRNLKYTADNYFRKYTDNNNFWDYMHLIKFYDQSVFKQLKKVIPARAKTQLGTVIEGNLFERPKSPVQRNRPSFTQPQYEDEINVSNFELNNENEDSRSIVRIETQYPNYEGVADNVDIFKTPSLYALNEVNFNYDDPNIYLRATASYGGPNRVFSEATGSMILEGVKSEFNQVYNFVYTSSGEFRRSNRFTLDKSQHFYHTKSLASTDIDPRYTEITAFNNSFYEGVKNTSNTTLDGDLPIIIRKTAPTVAVPTDVGISNLQVDED
mgnify:FL=1